MAIDLPTITLAVAMLAASVAAFLVFRINPRFSFVVWMLVLCFVPVWVGVGVGIFWAAITALTLLLALVHGGSLRPSLIDAFVVLFLAFMVFLLVIGDVRLPPAVTALTDWILPYFWGRIVLERMQGSFIIKCVAGVATLVAGLAVLEFITSTNLFVMIPGSGVSHATWSPLQFRGGLLRVEGAFGHSIALGGALAMCSAFVLATKWRLPAKLAAVVLLGIATVLTLSRIGMLSFALTVALSLLFLREVSARERWVFLAALIGGGLLAAPFLQQTLLEAGSEAEGSAQYRSDLLVLLSQVRVFGGSWNWESLVVNDTYLGFFARSTDNAVISILLRFGYVPTALLFVVLIAIPVLMLRGRVANPAGIAVVGQLPSLVAVAMITQYGVFLWFLAGAAISWERFKEDQEEDIAVEADLSLGAGRVPEGGSRPTAILNPRPTRV